MDKFEQIREGVLRQYPYAQPKINMAFAEETILFLLDHLQQQQRELDELRKANECRHIDEWHEDMGDKLWWKFPIIEAPYCGSPLDTEWPEYHTHFTDIMCPTPPETTVQI